MAVMVVQMETNEKQQSLTMKPGNLRRHLITHLCLDSERLVES